MTYLRAIKMTCKKVGVGPAMDQNDYVNIFVNMITVS